MCVERYAYMHWGYVFTCFEIYVHGFLRECKVKNSLELCQYFYY